jgi:hypothetical protein
MVSNARKALVELGSQLKLLLTNLLRACNVVFRSSDSVTYLDEQISGTRTHLFRYQDQFAVHLQYMPAPSLTL